MKVYFFIFMFLILILGIGNVSAVTLEGSPSSLNFNIEVGEQECLKFMVSSSDYSGNLNSIMVWAEKDAEVSNPSDFIFDNSEINLEIEYSPEIILNFDGSEEVEVCISGNEVGTWKGSLEYRTDAEGNIGIGVGTWLRVYIIEKTEEIVEETPTQITPSSTNSGGSSGGSSGGTTNVQTNSSENETVLIEIENSEKENKEVPLGELEEFGENKGIFGITGSSISEFSKTNKGKTIIIVVLAIILGLIVRKIYKKKFNKK